MTTIDEFKALLIGGGPRANRFKIFIPRAGDKIQFLAKAGNIPAATVGIVEVQRRGSVLKLAGDRTLENRTVSILNDVEFSARTAIEAWQQEIQELGGGNGSTTTDYLISRAFVEQLNKDDSVLARYEFFNMFPLNIGEIALSHETVDALESFDTEFAFSHWERVI